MDWPRLFETEVAPVLAAHAAPIPTPVLVVAGGLVLCGVALIAALSFPRNLVGLAPLLVVAFGVWAVLGNRAAVRSGETLVREGVVRALRVEKVLTDDTRTGTSEARLVHVVEVDVARRGTLTAAGVAWRDGAGVERLTTSESVYENLAIGDALTGVSLPIAPAFVHLRVAEDGTVSR